MLATDNIVCSRELLSIVEPVIASIYDRLPLRDLQALATLVSQLRAQVGGACAALGGTKELC